MGKQAVGESKQFRLPSRLTGKADQPKDVRTQLSDHRIAGVVNDMVFDCLARVLRLAVEQLRKGCHMALLTGV